MYKELAKKRRIRGGHMASATIKIQQVDDVIAAKLVYLLLRLIPSDCGI